MSALVLVQFAIAAAVAQIVAALVLDRMKGSTYAGQIEHLREVLQRALALGRSQAQQIGELKADADVLRMSVTDRLTALESPKERKPRVTKVAATAAAAANGAEIPFLPSDGDPGDEHRTAQFAEAAGRG